MKQRVFIVTCWNEDGHCVEGVFTTHDSAVKFGEHRHKNGVLKWGIDQFLLDNYVDTMTWRTSKPLNPPNEFKEE